MTERIFSAVLTFMLLVGGTIAMGSALFGLDRPASRAQAQTTVVELPRVEVTGRRNGAVLAAREADPALKPGPQ